ncbi:hypothetical protein E2C01_045951 [Portunus trituberculatus]|uniref:Uncharacterized protein n=1 Tax=Portunus trituberculatus TaxID=210409 RepID=A0A5B7FX51_PORTR|nr:hypothetical protein [Portunus trituberculatus]
MARVVATSLEFKNNGDIVILLFPVSLERTASQIQPCEASQVWRSGGSGSGGVGVGGTNSSRVNSALIK